MATVKLHCNVRRSSWPQVVELWKWTFPGWPTCPLIQGVTVETCRWWEVVLEIGGRPDHWMDNGRKNWFRIEQKSEENSKLIQKIVSSIKLFFLINSGVCFGVIMGWIRNQTSGENRVITSGASISSSAHEAALQTQQLFKSSRSKMKMIKHFFFFASQYCFSGAFLCRITCRRII